MMKWLIRSTFTGYFVFVLYWLKANENFYLNSEDEFVRKFTSLYTRFISNWTFFLITIHFITSLLSDILQEISSVGKMDKNIENLKSFIFTTLLAPTSMLVNIVFWSLWFTKKELIMEKSVLAALPLWVNLTIHFITSIATFSELSVCYYEFPPFTKAFPAIFLYYNLYLICLIGTYFETGVWIYKLYENISWPKRIMILTFLFVLNNITFLVTKYINNLIWSKKKETNSNKLETKIIKKIPINFFSFNKLT